MTEQQSQEEVRWMGRLILWILDNHYPTSLSRVEIQRGIWKIYDLIQ